MKIDTEKVMQLIDKARRATTALPPSVFLELFRQELAKLSEEEEMSELDKLEEYLKDHHIGYIRHEEYAEDDMPFDWHQICVGAGKPGSMWDWDVICHYGSYGYNEGLLEGRGTIFGQDVEGHLTAADVIERITKGAGDEHRQHDQGD